MNDSQQRKSGVILSYVSIILNTFIQLLYTPFLIKFLGQSEYGLYSLVASLIGTLTVLDLGFGNAIVVYTSKYHASGEHEKEKIMQGMFKIIFYIIGFISAIVGIILYFNVDVLFGQSMTNFELGKAKVMMLILTFNLVLTFSFSIYSSIINAYERFTFRKILSILNTILKPILMIPLLLIGYKSITMCVVITIINLFIVLCNYYYCKNNLKINVKFIKFDKKLFIEMFTYSIFIFMGTIVDKINWSVDQFILGSILGTAAVSLYSVASQLNTLFLNLSTAVSGVFLPKISKMVAKKASSELLTDEMIKIGRIQYFIIFLMASGLVLFGKEFIILWVGIEYIESYYISLILIIPLCFPLIQNVGLSIMQAMNKYKFKSISTLIMSIFNVIISILLARIYGAIGCAIGTAIALIICNIIVINIYYDKVIKLNIINFWREIIKMTITFLIPIFLILIIMYITKLSGILSILIYGSIYVILYGITSYCITMNNYEKNMVNKFLRKLHIIRS